MESRNNFESDIIKQWLEGYLSHDELILEMRKK